MKEKKKLTYKEEQIKLKRIKRVKWAFAITGWVLLGVAFFGLIGLQVKSCVSKKNKAPETTITTPVRSNKVNNDFNGYQYLWLNNTFTMTQQEFEDTAGDDLGTFDSDKYLNINNVNYYIGYRYIYNRQNRVYYVDYLLTKNNTSEVFYHINLTSGTVTSSHEPFLFNTSFTLDPNSDDSNIAIWSLLVQGNAIENTVNQRFTFNEQINKYGVLAQADSYFGLGVNYIGTWNVFNGYFSDANNTLYKGIKVQYVNTVTPGESNGYPFLDKSGALKTTEANVSKPLYFGLFYQKLDGTWLQVNTISRATYSDGNSYYNGGTVWVSQSFRYLTIFTWGTVPTGLVTIQSYTPKDILLMFNNTSTIGDGFGSDGNGVFDLIGKAFQSVASIFAMEIIPGITLGIFVFIPITIMVILFVVFLFKR